MPEKFILFFTLILLSGFFSGAEIAFFSLSPAKTRLMVRRGLRGAKLVERLKNQPHRLLVVILICNNLVNIFAAALATQMALEAFGSVGVGIATGVVTFLVLVFGEIFPKILAQMRASLISRISAPFLFALEIILAPIVFVFDRISRLMASFAVGGQYNPNRVTEEEIKALMHLGLESGSVEKHEQEFMERLFKFNDVAVKEIMVPLQEVVMLEANEVVSQISHFVVHSGFSRFPIFDQSKQNILKIVNIKEIFKANYLKENNIKVADLAGEARYTREDEKIDHVFRFMQREKAREMMVKNKNEKITGMITIEDIVEELVGEVLSESDAS